MDTKTSILIVYTGGTIGMVRDRLSGALKPLRFENLFELIPSLKLFDYDIDTICFDPLVDSSNMNPEFWAELASIIYENYETYDGFVVLHGTDTMAYTASALSFMLQNLNKPVILTGSQLPLGMVRTDGRENIIASVEIAAAKEDETPIVPEVCIYFENQLFRGNRTYKFNADEFEAFRSPNYPVLAEAGVYIKFNKSAIRKPNFKRLKINKNFDTSVVILKLFPGISESIVKSVLGIKGLKGVVLETYGSGNAPNYDWFIRLFAKAIKKGLLVLSISQCQSGSVEMGKYETSVKLKEIGVLNGYDITTEAAVAKFMYLLGTFSDRDEISRLLTTSIVGELTHHSG